MRVRLRNREGATGVIGPFKNPGELVIPILAAFGAFQMDHRFDHATRDDPRNGVTVNRPRIARQQHRHWLVFGRFPRRLGVTQDLALQRRILLHRFVRAAD